MLNKTLVWVPKGSEGRYTTMNYSWKERFEEEEKLVKLENKQQKSQS